PGSHLLKYQLVLKSPGRSMIGSLDHPEGIVPSLHYWDSKRLPWVRFADDLPRFPEFPPIA
ncbi:MAG: hypothetical protein WDZ66_02330, partial [Steroidobacteraceae bacterium]